MVEEEGICVKWCDGSRILRLFEDWSGICNWRLCTAAGHWMCSGVYFWNRLYLIFLAGGVKDPGFWDVLKIDQVFRMCTVQWGAFLNQAVSDLACCPVVWGSLRCGGLSASCYLVAQLSSSTEEVAHKYASKMILKYFYLKFWPKCSNLANVASAGAQVLPRYQPSAIGARREGFSMMKTISGQ